MVGVEATTKAPKEKRHFDKKFMLEKDNFLRFVSKGVCGRMEIQNEAVSDETGKGTWSGKNLVGSAK